MHDQPKYIPLRESTFFADGRSAREIVDGTVARGQLHEDALLYTGKVNNVDTTMFPFAIDARVMARGHERFDIYCSPCHGRTGQGDGMVVRRGYRRPPSLHQDRLRDAPASTQSPMNITSGHMGSVGVRMIPRRNRTCLKPRAKAMS